VATLKEVAHHAHVSTATVSKVLSNTPYVSAETRARVLQSVEALGYVPNLAARALSKGHTYMIGVVFPYKTDHLFGDPHILSLLEGIETICVEMGYNMLLSTPRAPVVESIQYQRLVQGGYLEGLITLETLPGTPVSSLPEQHGYPWVAIGYHSAKNNLNTIHTDDRSGARAIAQYLIQLGHRDIGVISVHADALTATEQRIAGYREAFNAAGLVFDRAPLEYGNFTVESGYQATDRLLAAVPRPTAILCLNDRMAMGAIQRAWAAGLRVPEDLSVVGFDDIPNASFFTPALTTVRQPAYEMGERAARMLFEIMAHKASRLRRKTPSREGFSPIVFPSELIVRGSATRPPYADYE